MSTTLAPGPVLEALHFRHATKRFDADRRISDAEFQTILEAARLSPTSFGLELWRLVVVQDTALRSQLMEGFWGGQGQWPTASHVVVLTVPRGDTFDPHGEDLPRYLREVKQYAEDRVQGTLTRLQGFFDREFHLETATKRTEWAARQSYIVLANMMTVAASLGIDSCPMEGFDLDTFEAKLDGQGGFDRRTHAVSCVVAFGYRSQEAPARKRRPFSEAVIGWA